MLARLLLLFIAVPLIELVILIQLGDLIGLLPTIVIVVLTGIAGAALARSQGFKVLFQMRQEMAEGRMPVGKLMDGLLILIAGALLLTPGLLTDIFGLSLLVPGTRMWVKRLVGRKVGQLARSGRLNLTVYTDASQY